MSFLRKHLRLGLYWHVKVREILIFPKDFSKKCFLFVKDKKTRVKSNERKKSEALFQTWAQKMYKTSEKIFFFIVFKRKKNERETKPKKKKR